MRILGDLEGLRVPPRAADAVEIPRTVDAVSMATARRAVEGLLRGVASS